MSIISGGSFCISANILKQHHLRQGSMPFDWLFCSVGSLIQILDDRFVRFLDPSYYRSITEAAGQPSCMHALYDGLAVDRPLFRHKDPTQPTDHDYYVRCVDRFHRAVEDDGVLLVIEEFGEIEERFDDLADVVSRHYPRLSLRAVRHVLQGDAGPSLDLTRCRDGHELWRLAGSPVVDGLSLAHPGDEDMIVRQVLRMPPAAR